MRYADNFDQDDDDFDEAEAEAEMMADALAQNNKNYEEQLKIAQKQMKYDLLDKAIFASRGWFWGFLPHAWRMYKISQAYETFKNLVD